MKFVVEDAKTEAMVCMGNEARVCEIGDARKGCGVASEICISWRSEVSHASLPRSCYFLRRTYVITRTSSVQSEISVGLFSPGEQWFPIGYGSDSEEGEEGTACFYAQSTYMPYSRDRGHSMQSTSSPLVSKVHGVGAGKYSSNNMCNSHILP